MGLKQPPIHSNSHHESLWVRISSMDGYFQSRKENLDSKQPIAFLKTEAVTSMQLCNHQANFTTQLFDCKSSTIGQWNGCSISTS